MPGDKFILGPQAAAWLRQQMRRVHQPAPALPSRKPTAGATASVSFTVPGGTNSMASADDTWTDQGGAILDLELDGPGSYLITYQFTVLANVSAGHGSAAVIARLWAEVAAETLGWCIPFYGLPASNQNYYYPVVITVPYECTESGERIRLETRRGSGPTWVSADIAAGVVGTLGTIQSSQYGYFKVA
jgi:hypothetical protein